MTPALWATASILNSEKSSERNRERAQARILSRFFSVAAASPFGGRRLEIVSGHI
jgi:hypothetical protein